MMTFVLIMMPYVMMRMLQFRARNGKTHSIVSSVRNVDMFFYVCEISEQCRASLDKQEDYEFMKVVIGIWAGFDFVTG